MFVDYSIQISRVYVRKPLNSEFLWIIKIFNYLFKDSKGVLCTPVFANKFALSQLLAVFLLQFSLQFIRKITTIKYFEYYCFEQW